MTSRTRVCSHCGSLVGPDEGRCPRCQKSLPSGWRLAMTRTFLGVFGTEIPMTHLLLTLCGLNFLLMMGPLVAQNPSNLTWIWGGQVPTLELMRYGGLIYVPVPGPDGSVVERLTLVEPWRLVSAIFVHLSLLHIVMNGLSLLSLGRALETRLGSGRFTLLFFVTGVAGYLASEGYYFLSPGAPGTAGASGGLFGLIGGLAGYLYARRDPGYKDLLVRVGVMALGFALVFPINNAAHIGGLVAGFPLGIAYYRESRPWTRDTLFRALAGLLVGLAVLSIALSIFSSLTRSAARQVEAERSEWNGGPLRPRTNQPYGDGLVGIG